MFGSLNRAVGKLIVGFSFNKELVEFITLVGGVFLSESQACDESHKVRLGVELW